MRISAPLGSRAHHLQSRVVRGQRTTRSVERSALAATVTLIVTLLLIALPVIVYLVMGR